MSSSISTTSSRPDRKTGQGAWDRRAFLTALPAMAVPAVLLAACSSDASSSDNYGALLLDKSLNPFAGPRMISREQAAKVSYASIGVRAAGSEQFLLILATTTGDTRLWTSASHIAILTRSWRILRTAGLPKNLTDSVFKDPDPVATGFHQDMANVAFVRNVDFADRNLFGVQISSSFSVPRREDIRILDATIKTIYVQEHCSCPFLDWTFTNEYWADINGTLIWRSVQTIHPDFDPVHIDVMRPPAG